MVVLAMTDIVFVFIFIPILLLVAVIKSSWQKYALLLLSLFYYACGSPKYFILFIYMLIVNITLAYGVQKLKCMAFPTLPVLLVGVVLNIGLLFYYKYYDFTIDQVNRIFATTFVAKNLLLPMGISFFIFKSISLLVDVRRGTVILGRNPIYSALYLSFFGQVVSGPICRYNDFYKGGGTKYSVWKRLYDGSYLFVRGFLKKVLLANTLSHVVVEIFAMDLQDTSALLLWIGSISYSLQLYYDFSGYSDMAIGIGRMFSIYCPDNFNYPYITKSVSEFWKRWHITLGAWFRDYVYIPLGGSRVKSNVRLYFNLFVVWMLTGLWHGDNWTFIFWGLMYFIAIAFEKTFNFPKRFKRGWSKGIYRLLTLMFINFQWVIFNSADLHTGLRYIFHMIIGYGNALANIRASVLLQEYGFFIVVGIIFATPVISCIKKWISGAGSKFALVVDITIAVFKGLLFICALSFVITGQNNPFLYGNF